MMPFHGGEGHIRYTPIREMLSRRGFFDRISVSLGGLALASLLERAWGAAPIGFHPAQFDVLPKKPHFAPNAKRVILLFQNGGPSQVDLFDPKSELLKRDGQKPGEGYVNTVDVSKTGSWLGSPFKFSKHGQCGMELSELIPAVARHADDIA